MVIVLAALGVVSGCGKEEPKAPPPRPPVDVTVMTVAERDTPVSFEFVGQTQSSREVEIRARVEGFLDKRLYVEGDLVRSGRPLFQIDTKPFNATLQSSKGQVAQQQAALDTAVANLNRVRPLAAENAVSKKDLDDAIGAEQRARAAVFAAEGQLQTAQLNLGYTTVYSPLTGLTSFAKLQEGSYLSASNNLLTTVSQLDPIWVNFSVSENETLRYRDEAEKGYLRLPKGNAFDVQVVLADGTPSFRIRAASASPIRRTRRTLARSSYGRCSRIRKRNCVPANSSASWFWAQCARTAFSSRSARCSRARSRISSGWSPRTARPSNDRSCPVPGTATTGSSPRDFGPAIRSSSTAASA